MHRYISAVILIFVALSAQVRADEKRPNFVFIVSEDNSHHYLNHFFEGGAQTPAIEALAANGLTFDNAFSNSPVCSVARTTLATSCYGPRIGTQFHRKYKQATLPDNVRMFQHYLNEAGYYTSNNSKTDYNANPATGWDESSRKAGWRNRKDGEPFFHMESHGQSHESSLHFSQNTFENVKTDTDPAAVKLADYFPDTPLFRYTHAYYHDRIKDIDDIVASTVKKLEQDGVLEDTFVFYFGDHGGVLPRGKGYVYESGLHVPLVIRIPENFKHLVDGERGERVKGFVSFIDFGPTVLNLAGVEGSDAVDGVPFLGQGVTMDELNSRDESFGYANRFDEKYDFIRSLRKGKYHYLRCYQNWLPDGLQNNYRYKMLAYEEWRSLFQAGKLNEAQSQFYLPKPVELLFDVEADPHEVKNLSEDPAHAEKLAELRGRLNEKVKSLPDLSFYPESYLVAHVLDDPVKFGQSHKDDIARYVDIANLATGQFADAQPEIEKALNSADPFDRYWGAMVCSSFGKQAEAFAPGAKELLNDENEVVQLRAAEFLGLINEIDPAKTIVDLVNQTDDSVFATEALNSLVYFVDHHDPPAKLDISTLKPVIDGADIPRRIPYLKGEPLFKSKKKKKQ
ncbi:MAG: sulfatase-like hydrolase/transferase [Verrucomicrobiales bacterium]|nr:sulfatase-like hydrolase/transferase [Verrucomicrobiales bacterium]